MIDYGCWREMQDARVHLKIFRDMVEGNFENVVKVIHKLSNVDVR